MGQSVNSDNGTLCRKVESEGFALTLDRQERRLMNVDQNNTLFNDEGGLLLPITQDAVDIAESTAEGQGDEGVDAVSW